MEYAFPLSYGDFTWLEKLLKTDFFVDCSVHGLLKKNLFCIHCGASLCHQCALKHCSHPLLQIRRYLYHDVVRLEDLKSLVDCSHVQRYIVNGSQAVFLNSQGRTGPRRDTENCCESCNKILQQSYQYCSIACKAEAVPEQLFQQAPGIYLPNDSSSIASSKVTEVSDDGDTCSDGLQKSSLGRKKGVPRRSPMF
ncbi:unnamed protein product [Victoria cruziana]